jgi:4-amino-4-deoxy-L-arabinose transferase-like glycosyltransferase
VQLSAPPNPLSKAASSGFTHLVETRFWILAAALISIMGAAQVTSAFDETATWDEPVHLAAGYSYLAAGDYTMNPEHPPLAKMLCALPLRLFYKPKLDTHSPEWKNSQFREVGNNFLYLNTTDSERLLYSARSVNIALTLLFAAFVAWWTRKRFGPAIALFALALFVFDPNIIAHGRYVTNDLAAALFVFTTSALWIEYLFEGKWRWLVLAGISLGCAAASKYSTVFLVPVLLVMFWWKRRSILEFAASTAVLAVLSISVLAVVYWPEVGHPSALPKLRSALTRKGFMEPILWPVAKRLPIKAYTFLVGLDRLSEHDAVGHPSYLLGETGNTGWWYYFPVAFAVKTPATVLAALAAAALLMWRSRNRALLGVVLLPALVYFGFAVRSHIDIGIRHLLPVYAFLYVAIAAVLVERVRWKWLAFTVPLLVAVESLSIWPYYLSFFNVFAGGPDAGPKYLLDSNIDWGQDVKRLGRYMAEHNIKRIYFCFFGNVDLDRYKVYSDPIPDGHQETIDGYVAISATPLYGLYVPKDQYLWLRNRKPAAIIGHSVYLYDMRKKRS